MASADLTLELLKRIQADVSEIKREQLSMGTRMASMEQHLAANQVEIARLSWRRPTCPTTRASLPTAAGLIMSGSRRTGSCRIEGLGALENLRPHPRHSCTAPRFTDSQ